MLNFQKQKKIQQSKLKFLMLIEGGETLDRSLLLFSKLLKTDSINLDVKVVCIRFINFFNLYTTILNNTLIYMCNVLTILQYALLQFISYFENLISLSDVPQEK